MAKISKVRVAAVQPFCSQHPQKEIISDEYIDDAIRYLNEAAERGAKIICYPENYPGPTHTRIRYKSLEEYLAIKELKKQAAKHHVYIIAGMAEREGDKFYKTQVLIGPDREIVGKYRKVKPAPWEKVSSDPEVHPIPGNEMPIFKTEYGNIGILICVELHWPELARVLALKGADMIFIPAGGRFGEYRSTWKHLIWARAIENLCYIIHTHNLWGKEDGLAMIAGPEEILAESVHEGVLIADLDLDRLNWLREHYEEIISPKPSKVVPGLLKLRRPELYSSICSPKQP